MKNRPKLKKPRNDTILRAEIAARLLSGADFIHHEHLVRRAVLIAESILQMSEKVSKDRGERDE